MKHENILNEDIIKYLTELYSNPLFKKGFLDFFEKTQKEGIEAARKFWNTYPGKSSLLPNASEVFERLIDFYIILGFVPRKSYEDAVKMNEELKKENKFLQDFIRELNLKLIAEGGMKMQELWKSAIDRQMELSKEVTKNFFELFKKMSGRQ